jgi:hypothetical protein
MSEYLVIVHRDPWGMNEQLFVARRSADGNSFDIFDPPMFQTFAQGQTFPSDKPFLESVNFGDTGDVRDFLQACMDAAFKLGMKPRNYEEPKNELVATKRHLEDMRSLVFKTKPNG